MVAIYEGLAASLVAWIVISVIVGFLAGRFFGSARTDFEAWERELGTDEDENQ